MPGDICPEVPAQSVQEVLKWNVSATVRKNGIHSNDSPTFQSKEPLHLKIRDHPTVDLGDISSNEKELLLEAASCLPLGIRRLGSNTGSASYMFQLLPSERSPGMRTVEFADFFQVLKLSKSSLGKIFWKIKYECQIMQ